jgi:glycerol-3-phosphate acyltransferase PlsY
MLLTAIGLITVGYLCGAVPFGLLVGKLKGIDIRTRGSGNIGATNVGRVLGRGWGFLVFGLDLLKGLLPTALTGEWIRASFDARPISATAYLMWVAVAVACVLGHMFPVYLRFRGGKGVATSVGAVLGVYPFFTIAGLVALALWVLLTLLTRYISVASMVAAGAFPILFALIAYSQRNAWGPIDHLWPFHVFGIIVAVLVIVRHRANFRRLIAGVEPRIGRNSTADKSIVS